MAYGMVPVNARSSGYSTGGFESFKIDDAAQTTNWWHGDLVQLDPDGLVTRKSSTATAAAPALGVAVGFKWVDGNGDQKWGQHYVGSASNSDAYCFVNTAFNQVYKIQSDTAWADTQRGLGAVITIANGDDTTGNSGNSLVITTGANDVALRIIGVIENGKNETSSVTTPDVLVQWMFPEVLVYADHTSI
tara:strand:+ start:4820 stop:5389 length:570 start_codon:yes stop_codon:yes gene_type:complete